jgi:hypothetical protein
MEDILQYELFQQGAVQDAVQDAAAAVAALLGAANQSSSETEVQKDVLKNLEFYKTLEVESLCGGEEGRQEQYVHVPVVYTPDGGKRPYKDSPVVYINAALFRQRVRSINCQYYTTQPRLLSNE